MAILVNNYKNRSGGHGDRLTARRRVKRAFAPFSCLFLLKLLQTYYARDSVSLRLNGCER